MLGSARRLEFETEEGRVKALRNLNGRGIDGLVVIGGNGSQTGAYALSRMGFPVVGVASTIDNDLVGSDITIGVDTALNIALESIDPLKTTASSHQRAFLVEVMGRHCGYLALMAAIAGGAEAVVLPEFDLEPDAVAAQLQEAYVRGKSHALVVVAEGAKFNADQWVKQFKEVGASHLVFYDKWIDGLVFHDTKTTGFKTKRDFLLILGRADFQRCLPENSTLSYAILRGLVRRLRHADRQIESLALLDVYGRVARTLLEMAEDVGGVKLIRHKVSRQDMAKVVGASREMVSRVMKDLEERGVIETQENGSVIIKERAQPE